MKILYVAFSAILGMLVSSSPASATDEKFRLSKVSYVMLGVADIKSAVEFYGRKLGLNVSHQTDDLVFFDAGTISLVVRTAVRKEPGATEIIFQVNHVQAAYEALGRNGVVFSHAPHLVTGVSWAANFSDPDGHVLSVFGPK